MTPHEREVMQMALEWIEAQPEPRMIGAWERMKALRACLAQPKSAECDGGQCGIGGYCKQCPKTQPDVPETAFGETEPVAWMYDWTTSDGEFIQDWTTSEAETLRDTKPNIISNIRPLYTTPPQREWVGLTHKEHMEIMTGTMTTSSRMAAVEAKLKEKNT